MISRTLKSAYYLSMRPPMRLSGILYKAFRAPGAHNRDIVKVQLGPGQRNYLEGWINLDANAFTARHDVWANLEDPLPFHDNSVDVFYSHHVIEHIPDRRLGAHFKDMRRCLKPGGFVRVGGPNGDMAIRKYLEGDDVWFGDGFPDPHDSIGGKLTNFILCRNEHLTILTPSYMREIAEGAGFESIEVRIPGQTTGFPGVVSAELLSQEAWSSSSEPHTLIIECSKRRS